MAGIKKRTFSCRDIRQRSFQFFQDMRNKKEFCDVTFQVGDESISAHRIIITASIPYFREILASNDVENVVKGISMPDIEPSAFKCLIEFAYSCEMKIHAENVQNLLAAACFLGVEDVREECCDFLGEILDQDNVISIREFAENLNCLELMNITDSYFTEHFNEISQTKGFLNWPLTYVRELISKDNLNVDNEKQVFEAALNWVKCSPVERSADLPELLCAVRMPLLKPLYLTKIVQNEELLRTSVVCRDLLDEARNYKIFPQTKKSMCSFSAVPRVSLKTTDVIQDNGSECIYKLHCQVKHTVHNYDSKEKLWHARESKLFLENGASTAALHNKMYCFYWGQTMQYNPVTNAYKYLSNMHTPRIFGGASSLKNKIYVCGGKAGCTALNTVECFEPEKNKWTKVCDMRVCRWGLSVVTLGEYVFVLGGKDNCSVYDSVERYDPEADKWRTMPSMPTKRSFAGAALLNGKIYVCGGMCPSVTTASATAEVYNPIKNRWKSISSMNFARQDFSLLACDGKLYALGGTDGNGKLVTNVEIYDPKSNEWTCAPSTCAINDRSIAAVVMLPASL